MFLKQTNMLLPEKKITSRWGLLLVPLPAGCLTSKLHICGQLKQFWSISYRHLSLLLQVLEKVRYYVSNSCSNFLNWCGPVAEAFPIPFWYTWRQLQREEKLWMVEPHLKKKIYLKQLYLYIFLKQRKSLLWRSRNTCNYYCRNQEGH